MLQYSESFNDNNINCMQMQWIYGDQSDHGDRSEHDDHSDHNNYGNLSDHGYNWEISPYLNIVYIPISFNN